MLERAEGNLPSAIENISKSISDDPSLPILYFQRAVFYHEANSLHEAMIDYSETLRVITAFICRFILTLMQLIYADVCKR